ncbi:MAG: hypothetical protein ABFC77_02080 [Thermoguttaceae bacterium]
MRSKTIFGALLVSVALCSQGFGLELLDRMLGLNCGGCGECKACAKVACCEKACPKACVPACEKACPKACVPACEKACPKACEKVICGEPKCKKYHATPVRDLFDNIKDMFEAKASICEAPKACEPTSCAKACPKACEPACEKACKVKHCRKVKACEPVCAKACEPVCAKACEPVCAKAPKCHKLYRRPVLELLEDLFGSCKKCDNGGCEAACGCNGAAPATKAPAAAPAKAPEAAPLPAAPKADPSASIQSRGIYQASRSLVRN